MKQWNLTELSLKNKSLVYYFMAVVFLMGILSYNRLGRMEDPDFVIRQMVVSVAWPGASARQMEEQVVDKIEKKLQDTPGLDYLKSYAKPGSAVVYVTLREDLPADVIRPTWLEARNLVNDMKSTLPEGIVGPFFDDRFDDVYGSIYALTGDGFSYEEMRREAETIRRTLLNVDSVRKVELLGEQTEKVYIEVATAKLAGLGIDPNAIASAVKTQNQVTPSGMIETQSDNVYLRMTGSFEDLEAMRALPIRVSGKTFRLGDIATVERRYAEPADPKMFFNGKPAVGVAVSMEKGGNILALGEGLNRAVAQLKADLPLGLEIDAVSDQPQVVKESIGDFVQTLCEAIVIVLGVSFLSLGLRTGLVVALCIPLVIAGTFWSMGAAGIDLHKVSLGALIIALGLLVDDAIIAVEMMSVKLEQGYDRFQAACYAYTATALPMLTGTFVTCAGFIPVGFSKGMSAEFTQALFPVIVMALVISWIVSVMVAPLLGHRLIRVRPHDGKAPYDTRFYRSFRRALDWCLSHRAPVLIGTLAIFVGSLLLLPLVRQEFFPPSIRPEIIVEMRLPEGSSLKATEAEAARFAAFLGERDGIENYSYYVGKGAPRFVLTTEPMLPATNYAQFVIVSRGVEDRVVLADAIRKQFADAFPDAIGNVKFIQTGPPAAYPVMLRVSGNDAEKVRALAGNVADLMAANPNLTDINFDWNEKSKVVRLDLDQDKLRALGVDGHTLALTLQTQLSGAAIAEFYDRDRTIDLVFRLADSDRSDLSRVGELPVYLSGGSYVPLAQVAKLSYAAEEGLIWRRDLKPTVTVRANTLSGVTGNDAAQQVLDAAKTLQSELPPGYSIRPDGSLENSTNAVKFMLEPVPAMIVIILTLLMLQLRKFSLAAMTLLTAPLGIVGVSIAMLVFDQSMGFVAQLGILALSGMIIRNSVILIDQIEKHIADGQDAWDAIVDSAVLRFRPIMLTAAAAILGMLPLMRSTFWGPMAVAIAGGLFFATILTLLVLPTMYAAWFKVKRE